ncbi:MAG TPA: hypothetical protein VJ045_11385 [Hyphomicrobiaceae bacterium]|nr:hypothetical protein [Hyphomicrobiaceae bacterium]
MGERTDATGTCNEPPCPGLAGSLAPSPPHVRRLGPFALVLVMAAAPVVYWLAGNPTAAADREPQKDPPAASPQIVPVTDRLPAHVEETRDAILAAAHSGRIDDLQTIIEWNELRPAFGDAARDDPVAYWKKISGDGDGREILAVLAEILSLAPARLPIGKDPENNAVYVWPYLAELPLDRLTPAQEVDLYRLMPPDTVKALRKNGKWTWWRLMIGADGTWHSFTKLD